MTNEEKELLLKDLCARMPYGVICHYNCAIRCDTMEINKANCVGKLEGIIPFNCHIGFMVGGDKVNALFHDIKPYLRPMSSITEEERYKLQGILGKDVEILDDFMNIIDSSRKTFSFLELQAVFDYLNSIHVDYRDLIPKGLANEAPKGMYNIN